MARVSMWLEDVPLVEEAGKDQVVKALAHSLAKEIGIIHTMECHSAITKNEILPILHGITYMWNLKNNANECMSKT